MKPHHLLSALLVAAYGLAATALVAMAFTLNARWPHELAVAALGVALGQVSLGAAWVAWGKWHAILRLGLLLALILAWQYPVAACFKDKMHYGLWGGLLFLYGTLVWGMLAAVRLRGYESTTPDRHDEPKGHRRPWQFSVGAVLSVTTLIAMGLGTARHLDFPWHEALAACLFCGVAAFGHAACVFIAFSAPTNWFVAGPLLVSLVVGFLLRFTLLPDPPYNALIWMCLAQAATVSLSASVLRVAGYRLSRNAVN